MFFFSKFSNLQYIKIRQNKMKNRIKQMKKNKFKNYEEMFEKTAQMFLLLKKNSYTIIKIIFCQAHFNRFFAHRNGFHTLIFFYNKYTI